MLSPCPLFNDTNPPFSPQWKVSNFSNICNECSTTTVQNGSSKCILLFSHYVHEESEDIDYRCINVSVTSYSGHSLFPQSNKPQPANAMFPAAIILIFRISIKPLSSQQEEVTSSNLHTLNFFNEGGGLQSGANDNCRDIYSVKHFFFPSIWGMHPSVPPPYLPALSPQKTEHMKHMIHCARQAHKH